MNESFDLTCIFFTMNGCETTKHEFRLSLNPLDSHSHCMYVYVYA